MTARRWGSRAALVGALVVVACGSDREAELATETISRARRALMLVESTSGGELAPEVASEVQPARARAEHWLEMTEEAFDEWRRGGTLAFRTMVPCLGRSLGALREALARHRRPIPESLRQAEALARTATEERCANRPARTEPAADHHREPE